MKRYLAVGIGGMVGAIGRYSISLLVPSSSGYPYGTLIANLIGCFLLSFLLNQKVIKQKLSPAIFTALGTGMIGAFTTFSTFAVETIELWQENSLLSISYLLVSIFGGLVFCFLGFVSATEREAQS